jgi:hypothetical protein
MDLIGRDAYISTAIPVAINRQMVDDPDATSIEDLHRNPVATIARWWTIQMRRQPKNSTAIP